MTEESNNINNADQNLLGEVLNRLERLESLIILTQSEHFEGNEPFEGDEAELLTRSGEAGVLADVQTLDSETVARAVTHSQAARLERFIDDLGLRFFSGSEFTPYWSRVRNGVRNSVPPENLWRNIVPTLVVLDRFRAEIGSPVDLLSTYRSEAYNNAIGGARESQHTRFRAIDFTCRRGTPTQWAQILRGYRGDTFTNPLTGDTFKFHGGIGVYPSRFFVHLDTRGTDADWSG
jgi:N-acetylmuramoyl-L-alanine amidase